MNVLFVVLGTAVVLVAAYLTYGKFLAKKTFALDDSRLTPAVEMENGLDYVPASKGMLLGQHFSAIAAAGPINGPIQAAIMFGWVPAMIWIVVGSIFVGGVHDMGALVASIRNKAKSITEVIRTNVSRRAWILFMIFVWITLVYVIVTFADITATSFIGMQTLENGEVVPGGGIATASILYLILPIIMGLLMKYAKVPEKIAIPVFLVLVGCAIWLGPKIPFDPFGTVTTDASGVMTQADAATRLFAQKGWGVIILIYCFIAAAVPMWLILQPRGAIGGYFLYASLLVAAIGLVFGGFTVEYPAFAKIGIFDTGEVGFESPAFWFPMWPVLFTTVACGACSGFHALVSSGTTSKQLKRESDAKPIGYGAMLLEGMVAMVAVACVMIVSRTDENKALLASAPNFIYAQGLGEFMNLIRVPAVYGITFGLMAFTTFVYDTLDVCTRLGRYIIEELVEVITGKKADITGKVFGILLTGLVPIIFIFQSSLNADGTAIVPAWRTFWGTFGAANQLLAALSLIGISVFLVANAKTRKYWLVAFIPAVFMFIISNWSNLIAIRTGWILHQGHPAPPVVALILIVLSIFVAVETVLAIRKTFRGATQEKRSPLDTNSAFP